MFQLKMLKSRALLSNSCHLCRSQFAVGQFCVKPSLSSNYSFSVRNERFNSTAISAKSALISQGSEFVQSSAEIASQSAEVFGLSAFKYLKTSGLVQDALIELTDSLGVSWPVALGLCAVTTRIMLLPVTVYLKKMMVRKHNIAPQRWDYQSREFEKFKAKAISGAAMHKFEHLNITNKVMQFDAKHGLSATKMFLPVYFQLPVILTMFEAIRDLSTRSFAGLANADLLWIPNLTLSDPFFLLPALNLTTVYLILRLGVDGPAAPFIQSKKSTTIFLALLPIGTYFMNSYFPSALVFYWFSSNCVGFVINKALEIGPVQRVLGIPKKVIHPEDFNEYENTRKMTRELQAIVKQRLIEEQKLAYNEAMKARESK